MESLPGPARPNRERIIAERHREDALVARVADGCAPRCGRRWRILRTLADLHTENVRHVDVLHVARFVSRRAMLVAGPFWSSGPHGAQAGRHYGSATLVTTLGSATLRSKGPDRRLRIRASPICMAPDARDASSATGGRHVADLHVARRPVDGPASPICAPPAARRIFCHVRRRVAGLADIRRPVGGPASPICAAPDCPSDRAQRANVVSRICTSYDVPSTDPRPQSARRRTSVASFATCERRVANLHVTRCNGDRPRYER